MKCWLLSIFSLLACTVALAQDPVDSVQMTMPRDTIAVQDTIQQETLPTQEVSETIASEEPKARVFQPQIYIDYGKLLTTAVGLDYKLEGAISFLFFDKFEAITEFGTAKLSPDYAYKNGNYESNGDYLRFGGGYMAEINTKSNIGLGVRYGVSRFQDQGLIEIQSESGLQDDYNLAFSRNDLTARWWSVVLTSESRIVFNKKEPEAKINHLVRAGFFFRMRFLVTYENDGNPVDVYSIPGYGTAVNGQQAAINLFLKFTP